MSTAAAASAPRSAHRSGVEVDEVMRSALAAALGSLPTRRFDPGEVIMREGENSEWFAYLASGVAEVSRRVPTGVVRIGVAQPGSVLGELALVTGRPRSATVTATAEVVAFVGTATDFHGVLADRRVAEGIARVVAGRLAALADPVSVPLANGITMLLRPGLSTDGPFLAAGLAAMSRESLQRRFFSGGMPPESVIRYLLDVDYVDHFAWVAIDAADPELVPIGSARFIRSHTDHREADIAFGLVDDWQGRGVGTLLMEALGVAAAASGIDRFTADVLRENTAMRRLLARPSTRWVGTEPGVVHAVCEASEFGSRIDPPIREALARVAATIVWNSAAVLL